MIIYQEIIGYVGFKSCVDRETVAKIDNIDQFAYLIENEDRLRDIFNIKTDKSSETDPQARIIQLVLTLCQSCNL